MRHVAGVALQVCFKHFCSPNLNNKFAPPRKLSNDATVCYNDNDIEILTFTFIFCLEQTKLTEESYSALE